jgi:hypothetical protein
MICFMPGVAKLSCIIRVLNEGATPSSLDFVLSGARPVASFIGCNRPKIDMRMTGGNADRRPGELRSAATLGNKVVRGR